MFRELRFATVKKSLESIYEVYETFQLIKHSHSFKKQ